MEQIVLNDNLKIWRKYSSDELLMVNNYWELEDQELFLAVAYHESPTKIYICGREFNVIPEYMALRSKSSDGYFRYIYIQINAVTGEYYIGKVNRKRLSEFRSYKGSGLKFKAKYKKHAEDFVMYYIAACETQEETESLEAEIVNDKLLEDPFCLNLVRGGGGVTNVKSSDEKKQKQREYMKAHPERYKAMIEAHKKLYNAGDSPALRARAEKIKATMSSEKYQQMMSERIINWRKNNPEAYSRARENNRKAMQSQESKEKRNKSLAKWREENPELYKQYEKKRKEAMCSGEARQKRSESLKRFNQEHPEIAKKRSQASVAKSSKPVNMLDVETREVLRTFPSQHAAAAWLVENGYAKTKNCVSSINAVCLHKTIPGHGCRTKTQGFGWEYADSENS
ncbi:hypothetical protein [Butyrivibrio proteoclasticus]|uniref:hypothetical protein n=1 Tax=Butyrivibrio proteoclasticus TaxID=43305 RepID=UPI00047AF5AB|nr:hypothetical protein [Butyrivibrio proteoclasticus]